MKGNKLYPIIINLKSIQSKIEKANNKVSLSMKLA